MIQSKERTKLSVAMFQVCGAQVLSKFRTALGRRGEISTKISHPFTREKQIRHKVFSSVLFGGAYSRGVGGKEHRGQNGRGEIGGVYLPSQLERIPTTLLVTVDRVKGGGRLPPPPPPSPGWAEFTIIMEFYARKRPLLVYLYSDVCGKECNKMWIISGL
jgi:hypothetical protein